MKLFDIFNNIFFFKFFFAEHGLVNDVKNKSFLHLPEYGIKIPIYSGSILLMEVSKTHHFTSTSTQRENMIGVALCQKQKVLNKISCLNDTVPKKRAAISA